MDENETIVIQVRNLGYIVAAVSAIAFVLLLLVSYKIAEEKHVICPVFNTIGGCTVLGHFPLESFIGLGFLVLLMIGGVVFSFNMHRKHSKTIKAKTLVQHSVKTLSGSEKKVYDLLALHEGTLFQSELVRETGLSKVKTSRVLDKMEAKGLVERRRRGMSNIIVLKNGAHAGQTSIA